MSISELQMSGISVVKSLKDFDWSWSVTMSRLLTDFLPISEKP